MAERPSGVFLEHGSTPQLGVTSNGPRREEIVAAVSGGEDFKRILASVDILVVPTQGHAGYLGPVFPQGTIEVLQFLKENIPAGLTVDIATADDDYEELTLHAVDIVLPTIHVGAAIGTIALNLISSYLFGLFADRSARRDARVRAKIVVESPGKSVEIVYDGPPEQFSELTRAALGQQTAAPPASSTPMLGDQHVGAPMAQAGETRKITTARQESKLPVRQPESDG